MSTDFLRQVTEKIQYKEYIRGGQIAFIINSANDVRKDPFFYNIEEGEIDIDFIESLFTK